MYRIEWLEEDQEWVVTSDKNPGLSWLDPSPLEALKGYMKMIEELEVWDESEAV